MNESFDFESIFAFCFEKAIFHNQNEIIVSFQRVKRDPTLTHQVAIEHLTELNERLESLNQLSDERLRYLEFEDIHWKVQTYFVQLEQLHHRVNQKYGDLHDIERLYNEFQVRFELRKRRNFHFVLILEENFGRKNSFCRRKSFTGFSSKS